MGGQAVLEGVMMRSPHSYAAVVRRKNGSLVVREQEMLVKDLVHVPIIISLGVVVLILAASVVLSLIKRNKEQ